MKQSVITLSIMLNLRGFCRGRAGAIGNCNDDDQSKCVGSGKLGELGACGDTAESKGGHGGNGGSGSLFDIKFKLDFHCRGHRRTNFDNNNLAMKKSTIDGNLDYLWELGELSDYISGDVGIWESLLGYGLSVDYHQGIYRGPTLFG